MKKITHIFILLVSFAFVGSALACSYIYQEPQERYDSTPIIFIGKITKLTHEGGLNGTRDVTFEVEESYKGVELPEKLTLTTGANSAMCGYEEDALAVGDIWLIYTSARDVFISSPGNQKYNTVAEARAAVQVFVDGPTMCPLNYAPVCGQKDTGIRCVTTPCPSIENKTYGNVCQLNADKAVFLYAGECEVEPKEVIEPVVKDEEVLEPTPTSSIPMNTIERETAGFFSRILNFFKSILGF